MMPIMDIISNVNYVFLISDEIEPINEESKFSKLSILFLDLELS